VAQMSLLFQRIMQLTMLLLIIVRNQKNGVQMASNVNIHTKFHELVLKLKQAYIFLP
jgi:hypothetical protein